MKHTVPLGDNRYIRLDSYGESPKTRLVNNLMVTLLAFAISIIAVPAMLGVDITNPSQSTHGNTHRTGN